MIEPWLLGILLITVFMVGLAFYVKSKPTVPSREERERSEILATLRCIEAALNRKLPESPKSSGNATPDAPAPNPKDRHEEND